MWLFSITLFVGAALVFAIQPMFAKFILPLFGSTPAVWNSSMVFFQTALLAAYLYAHASTRRLGVRRQSALHVGLLALPLLVLPIAVPEGFAPPPDSNPTAYLLGLLVVAVGLPFFVVATTAPLLQRWLADTGHPAAADPYFLYRASNLGSVIGLLAYPLVLEPGLRLAEQGRLWSAGYGLLAVLVIACAAVVWRWRPAADANHPPTHLTVPAPEAAGGTARGGATSVHARTPPSPARRMRWVGLAFVPSSLMLGLTTYLTTDIAPIPLFWAIPLSLYLLSFIIVFSPGSRALALHRGMVLALPWVAVVLLSLLLFEVRDPLWLVMPVHLTGLFVAAMVCHGELARDRPVATSLTGFYLLVALGGALGGVFAAIVAPIAFDSLLEYPLAIVLACLCLPKRPPRVPPGPYARRLDLALPLALGATAALLLVLASLGGDLLGAGEGEGTQEAARGFALGLVVGIALNFTRRPLRFGLAIGAIAVAGMLPIGAGEKELFQERSFFGVLRVTASEDGEFHELVNGTTVHGTQRRTPGRTLEPLTYYEPDGPVGQLMLNLDPAITKRAAIIGLGTGTMACYAEGGDRWTFYEIDPTVERIARDPRLFTFLRDCPGRFDVVLGDARLSLARAAGPRYGLFVLDAFSSDAIPTHLLTREALSLYRSRLREDGVLAFHISNNYLDLEPVLGNLASDGGLVCVAQEGDTSHWVAMAQRRSHLGAAGVDARWHDCRRAPGSAVWTDDFSNLVGALK
ncbi:MAG: fused MFS/spermidine synthase [Actinomycetota bacterium]|nr:fused MFS/spermidine synthase [Actinomycetota bacterium]